MIHSSKPLKDIFCEVVRYAAEVEKDGHAMSHNFYIQGSDLDIAMRAHSDLVSTNPQYSDLYKAFKATGLEIESIVEALPMEEIEALLDKHADGQDIDIGPVASVLEEKYEQQQEALFAIYQQTLSP